MSLMGGRIPKSLIKTTNRSVKPRTLKVISVCSICGKPVNANKNDKAYRHGFKRYKKKRDRLPTACLYSFSQEDDKPCAGSGKEVIYKRYRRK